jgi:hypothetical protein
VVKIIASGWFPEQEIDMSMLVFWVVTPYGLAGRCLGLKREIICFS